MAIAGPVISGNLLCAGFDCWIIIAVDAVEIYRRLSTARRLAQQVEPPSRICSDFSLAAGYAVATFRLGAATRTNPLTCLYTQPTFNGIGRC
jgi:hypothetical protein